MPTDFDSLILNEAPGGVVLTSPKGVVVPWTRGAERLYGYSAAEAVGRPLNELIGVAGNVDDWVHIVAEIKAHGSVDYEALRRKKDGALINVEVSAKGIDDEHGQLEFILSSK